jgi:hypothetical protein
MTRPRLVLAALCLTLAGAGAALAQKPASLADVGLTFTPPPRYARWTEKQVKMKYPNANPPKYVYAPDARGRVSIAVNTADLPAADLAKLREVLEAAYGQMPGIKWIKREYLTLNGTKWIHLEFVTKAVDTTIRNDFYAAIRNTTMVGVNFNCITAIHPKHQAELLKSRNTLKLH